MIILPDFLSFPIPLSKYGSKRIFCLYVCFLRDLRGKKTTYFYSLNHFNWGRILARYLRTLFSSQTIAKIGGDTLVSCLFSSWTIPMFICSEVSKPFNHKQILHRGSPNKPQQLREPVYSYCTCRIETDKSTRIYTVSLKCHQQCLSAARWQWREGFQSVGICLWPAVLPN